MSRSATWLLSSALGLLLVVGVISCGQKTEDTASTTTETTPPPSSTAPVQVLAVDLGRNIGSDKQVVERVEVFKPNDTVYASVHTSGGSPDSKLAVRWTFEDGQVVDQTEQAIAATEGGAATEFHISKPDGLPAGTYKVEVLVDGSPVQTREFRVTSG
jgi:hypothetical protein